jgi:hypothetical protein
VFHKIYRIHAQNCCWFQYSAGQVFARVCQRIASISGCFPSEKRLIKQQQQQQQWMRAAAPPRVRIATLLLRLVLLLGLLGCQCNSVATAATPTAAAAAQLPVQIRSHAGAAGSAPATFMWDGAAMLAVRNESQQAQPRANPALRQILQQLAADAKDAASQGPWTVMQKPLTPASGDKHDYMSVGSYWWPCTSLCNTTLFPKPGECNKWNDSDLGPKGPPFPDCSSSTGLPWYDHDGYHNPLSDQTDSPQKGQLTAAVEVLTLSAFFLGTDAHAERAAQLLRVWFLNSATRMNPNARFAQGIPGRCDGRGIGLIDFASEWPVILDCIRVLSWLGAWPKADAEAMRGWWVSWLDWVWSSKNGCDERAAKNNHGTNYDVHVLAVAAFVGNSSITAEVCSAVAHTRLDVQIGPNGTLPLEDTRTKSQGYHAYDTAALLELAAGCRKSYGPHFPGGDADFLYNYESEKQHVGLTDVMTWLLPYARTHPALPWPFTQILPFDHSEYTKIFRLAALAPAWRGAHAAEFEAVAEQQPGYRTNRIALTHPLLPAFPATNDSR